MRKHIYRTRVRYAEVDQMGVVYYANYLAYMESGRTGLLRDGGYSYARMEKEGLFLPVTECQCRYKGAAKYDEELIVETTIAYVRNASIRFNYKIFNQAGEPIVTAHTIHPFIDANWKIVSIPDEISSILSSYIEE